MQWTVENIYKFSLYLINKLQSAYVSPTDLFYAFNSEQRAYQSDLLGRFQARNNGKTGANTGISENEVVLTKLNPFTKPVTLSVASGVANKPTDFIYGLAARIDGFEVYMINKGQIQFVTNSVIDPPSILDNVYYATEYQAYYQIWPSTVTEMEVDYISDPVDVVWGFTLDGQGRPVYNSATSVQPQWLNPDIIEITKRTLKSLGVRFSSQDFQNYANSVITTGN